MFDPSNFALLPQSGARISYKNSSRTREVICVRVKDILIPLQSRKQENKAGDREIYAKV
jgi:hypothetical protein